MTTTVASLVTAHRSGAVSLTQTVEVVFQRIREVGDPAIFISLREEAEVLAEAGRLQMSDPNLPLYGIPVAVKDNIDVGGLPTTAACPAFSYMPERDAEAVARLKRAGAIIIGKTNLDQFATGLVGMRSPYGMPRNPLRGDLVSGGSSSGSAVAVARGIVPLALGTDTAGSGRVPAALNNIVGLKPSLGLVSTSGVVPACRSLDCVSIFALTVEDAFATLDAIAGHDAHDPYSRRLHSGSLGGIPARLRLGVPRSQDKLFFGDKYAELGFAEAEKFARDLGATLVEIDLTPFFETARLLYEGAWVAERTAAVGDFVAKHPDKVHPVTRDIISRGEGKSAVEAFRGLYRLQELRAKAHAAFSELRCADGSNHAAASDRKRTGGGSDRTQLAARHLHEFRQSAGFRRHCRSRHAGKRRYPFRRHSAGSRRPRRCARQHRHGHACTHRTDPGRPWHAPTAIADVRIRSARLAKSLLPWSAPICPACSSTASWPAMEPACWKQRPPRPTIACSHSMARRPGPVSCALLREREGASRWRLGHCQRTPSARSLRRCLFHSRSERSGFATAAR